MCVRQAGAWCQVTSQFVGPVCKEGLYVWDSRGVCACSGAPMCIHLSVWICVYVRGLCAGVCVDLCVCVCVTLGEGSRLLHVCCDCPRLLRGYEA